MRHFLIGILLSLLLALLVGCDNQPPVSDAVKAERCWQAIDGADIEQRTTILGQEGRC